MMREMNVRHISKDQTGMVAIFTVLVVMGVLTLLTIGFSNITRQAQKRTLDDQLSNQAFYAAETGINRAQSLIRSGELTETKTECVGNDPDNDFGYEVDAELGIDISCLLVDLTPTSLEYGSVPEIGTDDPVVTRVQTVPGSGEEISTIIIRWDTGDISDLADPDEERPGSGMAANNPQLLPEADWGAQIGVLRVDMVPEPTGANSATSLSRANTVNNSYSFFLYPSSQGDFANNTSMSLAPGVTNHGQTLMTHCLPAAATYRCQAAIALSNPSDLFHVRLQSYYNPTRVEILGFASGGSTPVRLYGSQAIVDSTGRVNDVSRRVQVRLPIRSEDDYSPGLSPSFSLFSATSICKRLVAIPGGSIIDGSGLASTDPACRIDN